MPTRENAITLLVQNGLGDVATALRSREEARLVLCEIYPTLGFVADGDDARVRDEQQVRAAAHSFAACDAAATLTRLFEAPAAFGPTWTEEGWILGAT